MERSKLMYDVYLSFMEEDSRKTFTDHLYEALTRLRIPTYREDGNQLLQRERARLISFESQKAIQESKVSIVIFSRNYANSRWCLEELVKILDCMKARGRLVLPLFYNVDPSDFRNQTGSYGEAFDEHKRLHGGGWVESLRQQKWRVALTEAANLPSRYDLHTDADGYEAKLIKKVVREVQVRIVNDKMMALEEEEAKLKEEDQDNQEKMIELHKQLESINMQAEILGSRRANLIERRSSLEEIKKQFEIGSDKNDFV